jgi:hypothetical protein
MELLPVPVVSGALTTYEHEHDAIRSFAENEKSAATRRAYRSDMLQALASVMGAMIGDIIEKWDWMMVQGIIPEEKFENDFGPIIDPRMAETYARWAWERQSDAV